MLKQSYFRFYATKKDGENLVVRPFLVTHVGFFECISIIS